MSDLVERLRALCLQSGLTSSCYTPLLREAADEIEGLRKIPNPARDLAVECNSLLAAKDREIERLRAEVEDDQDTIDILMDSEKGATGILAPLLGDGHTKDTLLLLADEIKAEIERLEAEVSALKSGEQIPWRHSRNRIQIAAPLLSDEQAIAEELSAWQAARDEVTEITPSNAKLLTIAERNPAPQEWYDEAKGETDATP